MDFDPAVGINMAHTSITLTRCTLPDRKSYESRVHVVVCTYKDILHKNSIVAISDKASYYTIPLFTSTSNVPASPKFTKSPTSTKFTKSPTSLLLKFASPAWTGQRHGHPQTRAVDPISGPTAPVIHLSLQLLVPFLYPDQSAQRLIKHPPQPSSRDSARPIRHNRLPRENNIDT